MTALRRALFGRIDWRAPPWAVWLGARRRRHPRLSAGLVAVFVLGLAGLYLGPWLFSLWPQPLTTSVRVQAPGISKISQDGELRPEPLTIHFDTDYPDARERGARGAARLALVGDALENGPEMKPAVEGEWRWADARTLRFQPAADWPAGTRYRIELPPRLFAQGTHLETASPSFTTPALAASLDKLAFYRHPEKPGTQRVVATLRFTHPVNQPSLAAHLSLTQRRAGQGPNAPTEDLAFDLRLAKHDRVAYLESANLELGKQERFARLVLGAGVRAAHGDSATDGDIRETTRIPSVSTVFRVEDVDARIVRDNENTPHQTLLTEFTAGVSTQALADAIRVWSYPADRRDPPTPVQIKKIGTRVELTPNATGKDFARRQSFRFTAPEDHRLQVQVKAGLESRGSYALYADTIDNLETPDYPREVSIVGDGALVALSGSRKLSLQSRGVGALKATVYRLETDQVNHLITQTRGAIEEADFRTYQFDERNLGKRFTRILGLNADDPSQINYAALDLNRYLKRAGQGLFVVKLQGWDRAEEHALRGVSDRRLILVSNLGVIAKDNADGTHAVFINALGGDQSPVAGAEVALLGRNGEPVASAATDASGAVTLPDVGGLEGAREPVVYRVRAGGDFAFLPYDRAGRRLDFSRFATGGEQTGGEAGEKLRVFVFSDRGIYRPGESGHLAAMVKRGDWKKLAGVPVALSLTDPRGNVVLREQRTLPADGFIEQSIAFGRTDSTGRYRARVHLIETRDGEQRRGPLLGETAIEVETFEPDSMRVHAGFAAGEPQGWISADKLNARVRLENLFGTPAQGRRVTARYVLTPTTYRFQAWPGYAFANPYRNRDDQLERAVKRKLRETQSDANGAAGFGIDLSGFGPGLYRLRLAVQGYESGGGDSVTATADVRVSPAKRLVGWKADGGLAFIKRDSKRTVDFVAVNPALDAVAANAVQLTIAEQRTARTLVERDDGTLVLQPTTREVEIARKDFAMPEAGRTWRVPTDTAGDFVARLTAGDRVLVRIPYTVAGARNVTAAPEQDTALGLKLDQDSYAAGETIEVQITAPYTGVGLLTIERDKVYAHKWFTTDQKRSLQTIRVPKDLAVNGYVNVTFVRSLESEAIFEQPLAYAVAPFRVDRAEHTLDVDLNVPDKVKPGETLNIGFQTARPGRIAVFAVDEGILQVADFATPRPLDTFLAKRALEVDTAQMADLLLPEFRLLRALAAPGGDGADRKAAALQANLNPFARGVRAPAAYWSGIIDATGKPQSVAYAVPDYFDGELRLMAVASGATAAGSAAASTTVRGPFVLQPSIINTAAPGDTFRASVAVTNALPAGGGKREITVSASGDAHVTVLTDNDQTLNLAPGREGRVIFRVRAAQSPGAAELTFRAASGDKSLTRTATLSVRPAVARRTTLSAGIGRGETRLKLPRRLRPELAEQRTALGYSPTVLTGGLQRYLADYPHACTEQLVSRAFATLGMASDPATDVGRAEHVARYNETIAALARRWQPDNGFGFWPGADRTDRFASIYAWHYRIEAAQAGAALPENVRKQAVAYLESLAGSEPGGAVPPYEQAYALYVLTRYDEVTTNYLTRLKEWLEAERGRTWRQSLTAAYMAAAYRQLKLDDVAGDLIDGYTFAEPGSDYRRALYSALGRNAQYLYLLARHFPERLATVDNRRIRDLVDAIAEGRYNTLASAFTVVALTAWGQQAARTAEAPLAIRAETRGGDQPSETLVRRAAAAVEAAVPLPARALVYAGEADRRLFYNATQAGYDRTVLEAPVREGVEIVREYLDADGEPVTAVEQGAELTVRIRVRALDNRAHDNVAVVDLLPGGFQIQRDSVRGKPQSWNTDYVDIREDRLVLYGRLTPEVKTFTYRVKATGAGTFAIPPAFAESMYEPAIHGRATGGTFEVGAP